MLEIIDFVKDNGNMILGIIAFVLLLLVILNIRGIDLNEQKPKSNLVQQVTVETFGSNFEDLEKQNVVPSAADNFCGSYLGDSLKLEKACNQLTNDNCSETNCCTLFNGKCVAGDKYGPTYKTE